MEEQFQNINKRFLPCLLLAVYCLLLLASCGRRGDPALIEPRIEGTVESSRDEEQRDRENQLPAADDKDSEQERIQITVPDSPKGLSGIYTGTSIVLVWDEITGQDIKYMVYRSSDKEYTLVGETVTTAFTDMNVEPDKKYYYKVSAVALSEGPLSKEIQIITEVD